MDEHSPDEARLAAAKELAQEVARSLGVRARRGGSFGHQEWPATYFDMKANRGGLTLTIEVSDSGCNVTGVLSGRPPAFSLNRPTHGIKARGKPVGDPPVKLFLQRPSDADRVTAFLLASERSEIPSKLALSGDELFAIGTDRFYLLHQSRDVRALHDRLDLIAQLLPAPTPLRLASDAPHRIKIGKAQPKGAERPRHAWGGTLEPPPICINCNAPAHLLLTIDATDRALGLAALGRDPLRFVFCLDCMVFPSLTYVDHSSTHPRIVRQDPAERHSDTSALEMREVELVPQPSAKGAGSKIGGSPKWVQQPEIPECIACGEPMAFLAQIASTSTLAFVDDGTLYTFVCAKCRMMASLVQSH